MARRAVEQPAIPGWFVAGQAPDDYACALERDGPGGAPCASIRARAPAPSGFGTLMQDFVPDEYRGRRVRFSATVRTDGVTGSCGLWMRVDGAGRQMISIDNMDSRRIRGTTPWTRYEVVLDVPDAAALVAFGILLDGPGAAWLAEVALEAVGEDVATTAVAPTPKPRRPQNLGLADE